MRKLSGIFGLGLLLPLASLAGISGEDNLIPYSELPRFDIRELAKATATQIDPDYLKPLSATESSYPAGTFQNVCPGETRIEGQKRLGGCSGFLIANDVLVAAGHCNAYATGCANDAWLFNHFSNTKDNFYTLENKNIYRCAERLAFKHSDGEDYVVMRLDRKVEGATPFIPNLGEAPLVDDPLAVLGYPLGLPFHFAPGGSVLSVDSRLIETDLDSFTKNSGSVVMNLRTGRAEGILTNGSAGIAPNPLDGCQEIKYSESGKTYLNRLQNIPWIRDNFRSFSSRRTFRVLNSCAEEVRVVAKFRNAKSNAFETKILSLAPGKTELMEAKIGTPLVVHARGVSGRALVRGQDFFGFEDQGRQDELGFKAFTTDDVTLCR